MDAMLIQLEERMPKLLTWRLENSHLDLIIPHDTLCDLHDRYAALHYEQMGDFLISYEDDHIQERQKFYAHLKYIFNKLSNLYDTMNLIMIHCLLYHYHICTYS